MKKITKRILSLILCAALIAGYIPHLRAGAAPQEKVTAITDPGTASTWESMMGTDSDGNRYSGRVWADKSVFKDGDTALLNSKNQQGSSFKVELEEDEAFQVIFSVLGSTMKSKSTVSKSGPLDVVLVLDVSTSMDDVVSSGVTRLQKLIEAANGMLSDLLADDKDVRIGIAAYNYNSIQVLPFDSYTNGIELKVRGNKYTFDERSSSDKGGTIQAFDNDGKLLYNNTSGYARGTNLQSGIDMGLSMLENAKNTQGRTPVAIIMTDGAANTASQESFYDLDGQTPRSIFSSTVPSGVALATLLTAAYKRAKVEDTYGKAPMIYGIGVDISGDVAANTVINPGAATNGFNSQNSSSAITTAYKLYEDWQAKSKVERNESYYGTYTFTYDHGYTGVTKQDIIDNINYVDTYYPVSGAQLDDTFGQIYEELLSGVFNPITSSTLSQGGTGVDDTPLIYVDFIGQHMEIKEIQSVTLFGASYGVVKNAQGEYIVTEATGTNPTTNEKWNTAEDIKIKIIPQDDGTQKLEIRINQEILPIILEQVDSETVGDETSSTITEFLQDPLRVYYTVGLSSDILLPNGEVDLSKLQGYAHIDDQTGAVSFYSNAFGVENKAENGVVTNGDAHVGFQPSKQNRYYYHQTHQDIFTDVSLKGTGTINWQADEYGVLYKEDTYNFTWLTYEKYKTLQDTDRVYTYVTYYHPTPSTADAANAAEEVTYLVYTDWGYLKESVCFYDHAAKRYINYKEGGYTTGSIGYAIDPEKVEATISAYLAANPDAQIYGKLGVESLRTSRLHNMTVAKGSNPTATATNRYAPTYTYTQASKHNDNDVVVWLGNNGKLTVKIDTGIALQKAVTEAIGNPDDTYELTVTIPAGVEAAPVVVDDQGNTVSSTYAGNVLTVAVKAGQTLYINGIPGGTQCVIGENIKGDYYIDSKTETVTVPLVSQVLNGAAQYAPATVTNAPYKYGNLNITKEVSSDHAVPQSVLDTSFDITVSLGAALAGKTFTVEDSAHTAPYQVTADANGNLQFALKATQTVHILALPYGTEVTVTEADPGSHFAVSYRTRNHSGEDADSDSKLVIPGNGAATAVVLNRYTPEKTSLALNLEIVKNFADASVASLLEGGSFTFLVQEYNASTGKWADIATKSIDYAAGQYGEKSATIQNVLENKEYTEVGTYAYRVIEQKGQVENVSYDRIVYAFDVVVTDNGGQLVAKAFTADGQEIGDTYTTRFVNTYDTAPISMDIKKLLDNKSGDSTVSAAGFNFKSIAVDAQGNPLSDPQTNSIFSDAAGEARISGVYTRDQKGTHHYLVYEEDDGKPGWTYSKAQYLVTVVVDEDENGKLFATMTIAAFNEAAQKEAAPSVAEGNKGKLSFTNTYEPASVTVDLDGSVKKVLTGATLEPEQFTFHVYKNGDRSKPVITGKNELNGDVSFVDFDKVLTFSTVGKHEFDIVENIPSGAVYDANTGKYVLDGMHYDGTVYDLVVEVTNDPATGKLIANSYFEDAPANVVTYHNQYIVTATRYALGGSKVLHGRAPRNGEFEFELYEGNTLKQTVSNKADGSFSFDAIEYTAAGEYTYTIREKSGNVPGVSYDGVNKPVTVTVTVKDEKGILKASASKENAAIQFENTYTAAAASVSFKGTKTLEGGQLSDNDFTFHLYETDYTFDISGKTPIATDKNEGGKFSFSRSLRATGTKYFVIVEDTSDPKENVIYDRTAHHFMVTVGDIGDGQLRAVITNMATGEASQAAASVSAEISFRNATFEEAAQKEVFLGEQTTMIDGQKVAAGDILTYRITYTNYTGLPVVADIMDTIPEHTTYVEGSADKGGTYAGTHVNWILSVAAGESVTVSFRVKVNETDVLVSNTAVIRDGVNTIDTNEVVNHTVDEILQKDVVNVEKPTVSIDGKKVQKGDILSYSIRYINVHKEKVTVTIVDTIPQHTTYVENSADQGGIYDSLTGKITWKLDVEPGQTVSVSFRVKVDDVKNVDVYNQATANDGKNNYETNEVINPIKPPSSPKTGDDTQLWLWWMLMTVSAMGITALTVFRKKSEQEA